MLTIKTLLTRTTLRRGVASVGFALVAAVFLIGLGAAAGAAVLAKVNGTEITDDDLRVAMEDLGASIPQQLEGKARDAYLLDYLIDGQLVAQKLWPTSSTRRRTSARSSPISARSF